jgi:hypothetical protein
MMGRPSRPVNAAQFDLYGFVTPESGISRQHARQALPILNPNQFHWGGECSTVPFSSDEFFAVFAAYNTAVWPAQLVLTAAAAVAIALAFRRSATADR